MYTHHVAQLKASPLSPFRQTAGLFAKNLFSPCFTTVEAGVSEVEVDGREEAEEGAGVASSREPAYQGCSFARVMHRGFMQLGAPEGLEALGEWLQGKARKGMARQGM